MLSGHSLWAGKLAQNEEISNKNIIPMKHEDADASFLQVKQLHTVKTQVQDRLHVKKIEKLGTLCVAEFVESKDKVYVTKVKGHTLSHFGHSDEGRLVLHPEEAYFLMDVGSLRVYYQERALSLQEAYCLFFKDKGFAMEQYLVYSFLNRLGYIVRRYTKETVQKEPREKKIDEAHPVKRKSDKSWEEQHYKSPKPEPPQSPCLDVYDSHEKIEVDRYSIPHYTNFDYSDIEFPLEGGMRPIPYAKHQVCGQKNTVCSSMCSEGYFNQFSMLDYRCTTSMSTARNWADYHRDHVQRLKSLSFTPNTRDVGLVNPNNYANISLVLDELKLSEVTTLRDLSKNRNEPHLARLVFDVFQPNPDFRKSNPGKPHHRVVVIRPEEPVLGLLDVSTLLSLDDDDDDIMLQWAICDGGDISFYCQAQEFIIPDLYLLDNKHRSKKKNKTSMR